LEHLTEKETGAYIAHRLKVAGSTRELFTPEAITEIYNFSGGAPRLINIICDRALLTGFVEEQSVLDLVVIDECAKELKIRPYKQKNVPVKPAVVLGPNGKQEQKNELEKKAPDNAAMPDFEIRRPPRKKDSMLGVYCIYLLLIVVILATVVFFFFSPDSFSLSLSSIKNILFPSSGEIQ
ncbi:MAG: hypothetical protein GQ559_04155, partial [Desulfobulbaceae bacterium]|nr:hypothetical protein [Desulfobulbaceae bacterium]